MKIPVLQELFLFLLMLMCLTMFDAITDCFWLAYSAGVGRTGVFIALDIALNQAREEGRVDVIGTINNMRFQRMKMVQTLVRKKSCC